MSRRKELWTVSLFLVGFIFYTGCALPSLSQFSVEGSEITEIFRSAYTITLKWVDPNVEGIVSYNIFYKTKEGVDWLPLTTIPATNPSFDLNNALIGNGSWVFGVVAIDDLGNESEMHTSLETSADPATGWYLLWID